MPTPHPTNPPTPPPGPPDPPHAPSDDGRSRHPRSLVRRLVIIVVASYLSWCTVLLVVQGSMLFPRNLAGSAPAAAPAGAEQLWITTPEGYQVEGLYFPAPDLGAGRGPAVIFAHGNAELAHHNTDIARMYNGWGISVLIPEYRGYGNSGGTPSQGAIGEDFRRFHDWLIARPEVDPAAVILHGRSLGGAIAAQLASDRPPAALILQATFTSVASFSWSYGVPPALVRNPFRTDQVVVELGDVPLLIMHGRRDTIIPVSHGRRLRSLAPHADYYETDDGHNDFPSDGVAYRSTLREFLAGHGFIREP